MALIGAVVVQLHLLKMTVKLCIKLYTFLLSFRTNVFGPNATDDDEKQKLCATNEINARMHFFVCCNGEWMICNQMFVA